MRISQLYSNENQFAGKVIGSGFWSGRWWLHLGNKTLNAEWSFLHRANNSLSLNVEWGYGDGDDGIMFHAAIPKLFSVFISFSGIFGKLFRYPNEPRETGFFFHDGTLFIHPFSKVNSWHSKDKWWSKGFSFTLSEFLFGRWNYSEENDRGWQDIEITMPEGKYKGKLRLYTGKWKNRFWSKRIQRAEIEMEEGIPYPGKGENSWDCGEDASYGITCPAVDEADAIAEMIKHVLSCRRKYGCRKSLFEYTPEKKYLRNNGSGGECGTASC